MVNDEPNPLRAIVAALPLPALVVDADGVALAANTAACVLLGVSPTAAVDLSTLCTAETASTLRNYLRSTRAIRELTLDNLTPPAVCVLSRVRAGDGASFICTLRGASAAAPPPASPRRAAAAAAAPAVAAALLAAAPAPAAAAPPSPPSPFGTAPSPGYPTRARAAPPPAECYADLAPPPPMPTASGAGGLRPACTLIVAQRCANSASHALLAALRKQGYSVVPVDRGAAALERLRTRRQAARDCRAHPADGGSADGLQLLLTEARLPDMSAAELLRAINAEALHIPVVVLVPRSERGAAAEELLALGAVGCLQRPLHAAELSSLWQLALQHVALGFYAAAAREGERREQRDAFWARFRSWESGGGWAYAVPPP